MRELKFRGRVMEKDDHWTGHSRDVHGEGDWVYGHLFSGMMLKDDEEPEYLGGELVRNSFIMATDGEMAFVDHNGLNTDSYRVDPESVGEFTGLKDIDGKDIYEGDVLHDQKHQKQYFKVTFMEGVYGVELIQPNIKQCYCGQVHPLEQVAGDCEIVGNVHEPPEPIAKEAQQ